MIKEEFLNHKEDIVRQAAVHLNEAVKLVKSGDLSQAEFDELAGDILDLENVAKLGKRIKNKALVERAFVEIQDSLPGLFL